MDHPEPTTRNKCENLWSCISEPLVVCLKLFSHWDPPVVTDASWSDFTLDFGWDQNSIQVYWSWVLAIDSSLIFFWFWFLALVDSRCWPDATHSLLDDVIAHQTVINLPSTCVEIHYVVNSEITQWWSDCFLVFLHSKSCISEDIIIIKVQFISLVRFISYFCSFSGVIWAITWFISGFVVSSYSFVCIFEETWQT